MMIKTRIYLVTGSHVDVQESYKEVEFTITYALDTGANMVIFTLENGENATFMTSNIVYFTKF